MSRFHNNKLIGKGGFGKIWKSLDSHTNQYVAVKSLPKVKSKKQLITFKKEIYVLSLIKDKKFEGNLSYKPS